MNLEQAGQLDYAQWQELASELKETAETRLFVGGEFVDAVDGGTFDNISPVDGSVINACAAGKEPDINKAVAIARAKCFESLLGYTNIKAAWFRLN
jgi:hypothetical protein